MTWSIQVLMAWIQRIEAKAPRATLFELLELGTTADNDAVAASFHRIAAGAHPDLHRRALSPTDAERLVSAYGKIAAAYDTLRDPGGRARYRKELTERGRPVSQPPVIGGSQPIPVQQRSASSSGSLPIMPRTLTPTIPRGLTAPAISRTTTPSSAPVSRTTTPSSGPTVSRTTTPSSAPATARTTTAPVPRATTAPPTAARTTTAPVRATTGPAIARTTTPPAISRTTTPPTTTRAPLITSSPERVREPSQSPASTRPPPGVTQTRRRDSRPPTGGVGARAQIYFRKAQSSLDLGDLGGALFNLRLAAAADPTSALVRVALAEVEAALSGKK